MSQPIHDIERAGEDQANFLRIVAVLIIYLIELLNYYGIHLGPIRYHAADSITPEFHLTSTTLVLGWVCSSLAAWYGVIHDRQLKLIRYVSTLIDILLLTSILLVGDGPRSSVAHVYLLIIFMACLRLDARLVRFAGGTSLAAYIVVIAYTLHFHPFFMITTYGAMTYAATIVIATLVGDRVVRNALLLRSDSTQTVPAPTRATGIALSATFFLIFSTLVAEGGLWITSVGVSVLAVILLFFKLRELRAAT